MAFKMRSGSKTPFKLMGAKDAPVKMMKKSPSKLMKKSPAEFNPGLKKAAASGKLDKNPKFKEAVEDAPAKMMKKSPSKMAKKSPSKMAKKSPAKIIPGLKKKGTKGTKFVDKLKAFGKAVTSTEGGMAVHEGGNKAMRMYKGLKAKYRRERAAKEAAKNKK